MEKKSKAIDIFKKFDTSIFLSKCSTCPFGSVCSRFKEKYKRYYKEYKKELESEIDKIKQDMDINIEEKNAKIRELKQRKSFDSYLLEHSNELCEYERDIAKATYEEMNAIYDIERNKNILPLVEEIVKLKLYDFQFRKNIAKDGVIYNIVSSKGKTKQVNPSISFSFDISKKISDIIKTINEIVFGTKSLVVEGKIDLNNVIDIKQLFGTHTDKIYDVKKIE